MGRWRSAFSSLTILGMLFWLGTAMAPTVTSPGVNSIPVTTLSPQAAGPLLSWPDGWCTSPCPEPFDEPTAESDHWRARTKSSEVVIAPQAVEARIPSASAPTVAVAPPAAPRPVEEWRALVSAYFAPADVELALVVISCESGGDPSAQNRRSGAAGLFQHIPRYWEPRAAAVGMPGASIFDPVANVAAAAWLVANEGWRPWVASVRCWG